MEIQIPNINSSASTELVLVEIISLLKNLINSQEKILLDFNNLESIHPFLIPVLSFYTNIEAQLIEIKNLKKDLKNKLDEIGFIRPLKFKGRIPSKALLIQYNNKQNLPICLFELKYDEIDQMESELRSLLFKSLNNLKLSSDYKGGITYLISELTDNIKEHSQASHGLIFLDSSDNDNLYIGIADNGINILGSYLLLAKPEFRILLGNNSAEALRYSVKGLSTKNNSDGIYRGYGLSTNIDMVTNGLKGDFAIFSGEGLFFSNPREEILMNLPNNIKWDGTLILVKIPLIHQPDFKYTKYLE